MSKILAALNPMSLDDKIKSFLISEGFKYDDDNENFCLEFQTDDIDFSVYVFEQRMNFYLYFSSNKPSVIESFTHSNDFEKFDEYYNKIISLCKEKIAELFLKSQ